MYQNNLAVRKSKVQSRLICKLIICPITFYRLLNMDLIPEIAM
jgi:hypothetical protein